MKIELGLEGCLDARLSFCGLVLDGPSAGYVFWEKLAFNNQVVSDLGRKHLGSISVTTEPFFKYVR